MREDGVSSNQQDRQASWLHRDGQLEVPHCPQPALVGGGEVVEDDQLLLHRAAVQTLLPAEWSTLIGSDPSKYCTLVG